MLQIPIETGKVSDGYHTFDELYAHRVALFLALCKATDWPKAWKHHYDGWPVIFLETPMGQISYHVPERLIPTFEKFIPREDRYAWDSHTPDAVVRRLEAFANEAKT